MEEWSVLENKSVDILGGMLAGLLDVPTVYTFIILKFVVQNKTFFRNESFKKKK